MAAKRNARRGFPPGVAGGFMLRCALDAGLSMARIDRQHPLQLRNTGSGSVSLRQHGVVRGEEGSAKGIFHARRLILAGFALQAADQRPASIDGPTPMTPIATPKALLSAALAGAIALSALAPFAAAQTAEQPAPQPEIARPDMENKSRVVARVNGHDITVREIEIAADDLGGQLPEIPANMRYPFIVEYLIERHLLAQAAVAEGVAESDEYKQRLAFYQAKALRDAYFSAKLRPLVTDDEVKAAYERESAKVKTELRARARHILVASEAEAQAVIDRLNNGEKFEDVARQVSIDGSKEYGGDLGYFTAAEMVPEFSKAAFALKPGQVSKPVKTSYGWHVIEVIEFKEGGPQPYDQVKGPIRSVLLREKVQAKVFELREKAKIEVLDEDLKKLAERTQKRRDAIIQNLQKQGQGAVPGGQPATTSDGKGDLGAPQQ
jgi:peptidyl-prolyl cis-trans isomerase C